MVGNNGILKKTNIVPRTKIKQINPKIISTLRQWILAFRLSNSEMFLDINISLSSQTYRTIMVITIGNILVKINQRPILKIYINNWLLRFCEIEQEITSKNNWVQAGRKRNKYLEENLDWLLEFACKITIRHGQQLDKKWVSKSGKHWANYYSPSVSTPWKIAPLELPK